VKRRTFLAVFVGLALVAALRPWTIRPLRSAPSPTFDSHAYVEQIWPRLRQEAVSSAISLTGRPVIPSGARAVFVTGAGVVDDIDRQSRVGLAYVRIAGRSTPVAIQIGPVFRGTAVRDAASFIRFTDFINQFAYAAVADGLSERTLTSVLGPADVDHLKGRTIQFTGAVTAAALAGGTPEIVPVDLVIAGQAQ
jgi:predicted lipoprotein